MPSIIMKLFSQQDKGIWHSAPQTAKIYGGVSGESSIHSSSGSHSYMWKKGNS